MILTKCYHCNADYLLKDKLDEFQCIHCYSFNRPYLSKEVNIALAEKDLRGIKKLKLQVKDIFWMEANKVHSNPEALLVGFLPAIARYEIYKQGIDCYSFDTWEIRCDKLALRIGDNSDEWILQAKQICQEHAQSILEGLIK